MSMPEAPFLDFAAEVKQAVRVPVIAVGRLGDPEIAAAAVASGKADFIALGRTLIADPQWVEKLRRERADPALPRLQHLHQRDARRGAHRLRGQRRRRPRGRCSPMPSPPRGERIAVIGAGPAGLTYASLVADGNEVTVFEKDAAIRAAPFATPARRRCFQEVEASERSFERYIADLVAACARKGVAFDFATDVSRSTGAARAVRSRS